MAPPFRGRALRRPGAAGGAPSTWRPCATGQDPPNVGGGGGGLGLKAGTLGSSPKGGYCSPLADGGS